MLQPLKYLHCVKLMEAGLANSALDYVRVLADYVVGSVAGGRTWTRRLYLVGWETQHS